jgi:transposase, IS6 family
MYLYQTVDSRGLTIDFLLSAKRDVEVAKWLFRKALAQPWTRTQPIREPRGG